MNKKIYDYTQVLMAYHSERMEGCAPSFDECEKRFRSPGDCEVSRHFKLFDYMLETQGNDLTEDLILGYHSMLANGGWRDRDSTMDRVRGALHYEEIPKAVKELLAAYRGSSFSDIVDFLARYEKIHPFCEQCGAVGRMLVYKECLRLGLQPVVIYTGQKTSPYYTALAEYDDNPEHFRTILRKMRNRYAKEIAVL